MIEGRVRRTTSVALCVILVVVITAASCRRRESALPAQTAPSPPVDPNYDIKFLDTMIHHHGHAIEMWELVGGRAAHRELQQYAEKAIAEQKREIMLMDRWRDRWWKEVPRPPAHEDAAPEMTSHLKAARGEAFDAAFLATMIPHHQRAAAMAGDAVLNAEMPEVRELAQIIVNQQEEEVAIMSGWQKAWVPGSSNDAARPAASSTEGL